MAVTSQGAEPGLKPNGNRGSSSRDDRPGAERLTTAQAAARRSVGKPTLGELVASATVSWPSRGLTSGNNRSVGRLTRSLV